MPVRNRALHKHRPTRIMLALGSPYSGYLPYSMAIACYCPPTRSESNLCLGYRPRKFVVTFPIIQALYINGGARARNVNAGRTDKPAGRRAREKGIGRGHTFIRSHYAPPQSIAVPGSPQHSG